MLELDVMDKPHLIFNIDEKGCRLNLHKAQQVFARKGSKRVHLIGQEHAENVSIVGCGNALGQMIPPMLLFKGKRKKIEWMDNLPPGSQIEMTEKGSMTTATFITWLDHFAKFMPPGNVLLIFDGASSHLDANIVDAADSHGVTLFCLPSNTTHELQPMDKAVFKAFETYWDEEVMLYWTNKPNRTINKFTFGKIFSKVWPRATTPTNVMAGFRATGIFPYDPNIIPDVAFAPSEITERHLSPTGSPIRTSTPTNTKKTAQRFQPDDSSSLSSNENFSLHDSSSSSENNASSSFKDILITPEIESTKAVTVRKKSLNYRAQKVTKALFQKNKNEVKKIEHNVNIQRKKQNDKLKASESKKNKKLQITINKKSYEKHQQEEQSRPGPSGLQSKKTKQPESWFCNVCLEDVVKDMRLCVKCTRYVHEECVGLTSADKDIRFVCPDCED